MKIKIIAAIGRNRELGKNNSLPMWNLKTDFSRFKKLTEGNIVVMGQRTFESLPEKWRPLPNRRNVVLTSNETFHNPEVEIFKDIPSMLKSFELEKEIWIMGGGSIYNQFIDKADELHLTHVDGEFDADTFFPLIDENIWKIILEEKVPADEKNTHETVYKIYERRT